jgi:hypothetical protein
MLIMGYEVRLTGSYHVRGHSIYVLPKSSELLASRASPGARVATSNSCISQGVVTKCEEQLRACIDRRRALLLAPSDMSHIILTL